MNQEQINSFIGGSAVVLIVWLILSALLIFVNNQLSFPVYGNELSRGLGIVLFAVGLVATLLIVGEHFKTGRVTPVAVEKPIKFIATGLYRYSRNPMYLTILLTFFGGWLVFGHLLLFIYVLLAIPAVNLIVIYMEEPELKKIFEKEYEEYLKRVPRWL